MSVEVMAGVTARTVTTPRLTTRVLFTGPEDGVPVLFIHGNFSSATWWEETMLRLPPEFRGIAPDLRGFGDADPDAKVDATRGMQDFVDDGLALMDHLGYDRFHLVGVSLGGVAAWWFMAGAPGRLLSVTQSGPGSPFGFGGTRDAAGTPTFDDFAGSGGGLLNPVLIEGVKNRDRSAEGDFSPRVALRRLVWGEGFIPEREEQMLDAMFRVHLGDRDLPGDFEPSPNWPYVRPGRWGATNAMSPKYAGDVCERILAAQPRPPVLWIYGTRDVAVCDSAASDPGTWGPTGRLPGFPGPERYPPQPMLKQTRRLLAAYRERGGRYDETPIEGAGHVVFLSHPEAFDRAFHAHLQSAA